MLFLFCGERRSSWDAVPFLETAATTGGRRMLADEDGVVAPGSLFAVIAGRSRCEPGLDKLTPLFHHLPQALSIEVCELTIAQSELSAERRLLELREQFADVAHNGREQRRATESSRWNVCRASFLLVSTTSSSCPAQRMDTRSWWEGVSSLLPPTESVSLLLFDQTYL